MQRPAERGAGAFERDAPRLPRDRVTPRRKRLGGFDEDTVADVAFAALRGGDTHDLEACVGHSHHLTASAAAAPTTARTAHISHGVACASSTAGSGRGAVHIWQCPHGTTGGGDGSPTPSIALRAVRAMQSSINVGLPVKLSMRCLAHRCAYRP